MQKRGTRQNKFVSKLASDGLRVKLMNPEKFDEFIKKEVTKWSQLVRDNKIVQQ